MADKNEAAPHTPADPAGSDSSTTPDSDDASSSASPGLPLGGYRQAPPDPEAPETSTPRQHLRSFDAGLLGPLVAELDLGDRLEIAANRRLLRIDAGGGLLVHNSRQLPEIVVRSIDLDLGTLDVDLDADGIAGAEGAAIGIASAELLSLHVGAPTGPDHTLVDLWLEERPADRRGRRQLLEITGARTSLWLDPDADLRLRASPQELELVLSEAIHVVVLGIGIGIAAMRYVFAQQRVELERAPGLRGALTAPLLLLCSWFASRWLSRALRGPVGAPGYDPWADEDRLRHLSEAIRTLTPARSADPTDSTAQERPSLALLAKQLRAQQPGADLWIVARLPVGEGEDSAARGEIGVALRRGSSLRIRATAHDLTLSADGGIFLYADDHPALDRIHVLEASFSIDQETATLTTEPALGTFSAELLDQLLQTTWLPKMPSVLQDLLRSLRERPGMPLHWRRELGSERVLILRAAPEFALELSLLGDRVELTCGEGLRIEVDGAPLPPITLNTLRYLADGTIEVLSEPALGELEQRALAEFIRHSVAPRIPAQVNLFAPDDAEENLDEGSSLRAEVGGRTHVIYGGHFPQVGALQVLLDPDDILSAVVHPSGVHLRTERGILITLDELELDVDILEATLGFDGSIEVHAQPAPGPFLQGVLEAVLRDTWADKLAALLPAPAPEGAPWVLLRRSLSGVECLVQLPPGGTIEVQRDATGVRLDAPLGVQLLAPGLATPEIEIALQVVTWTAATDAFGLGTEPAAGDLLHELAQHILGHLGRPVLDRLRSVLALPEGPAIPPPTPKSPGPVLQRRAVPRLGELELALQRTYFMMATADEHGRLNASVEGGLRVRIRQLGLQIVLEELELDLHSGELHLTTQPELGPLESALATAAVRRLLPTLRRVLWPADALESFDGDSTHMPLAVLARTSSQGPLNLTLPEGSTLRIALDRQMLEVECEAGLRVDLEGATWLPAINLEKVSYTLADGAIDLRFQPPQEQHYHEAESVSTATEAILSDLLRVLVHPRIPASLEPLGFVRLEPPSVVEIEPELIELFSIPLVDGFGAALLGMDPDETITITASEEEVNVSCERGLSLALPALRLRERIAKARSHVSTGEVQVEGLGQIENMIIEAVIRKNLRNPAPGGTQISGMLDALPIDAKGYRQLFANSTVAIRMKSGSRFTMALNAAGIDFTADPPLEVDGPAVFNYELHGFNYSFATARFSLILDDDGVLANLFTGIVADRVETEVNEHLRPLLPPVMRVPGYTLAKDPDSAASLAAVVANFGMRKGKGKGKGKKDAAE